MLVDSCAMGLIRQPRDFDVIVTENMFGDILTDEAAMLAGSMGMLPSASLGTRRTLHGQFGLYEPIHGTAPDITGQGKANPLATILSAALLLRHSLGLGREARTIERAVRDTVRGVWPPPPRWAMRWHSAYAVARDRGSPHLGARRRAERMELAPQLLDLPGQARDTLTITADPRRAQRGKLPLSPGEPLAEQRRMDIPAQGGALSSHLHALPSLREGAARLDECGDGREQLLILVRLDDVGIGAELGRALLVLGRRARGEHDQRQVPILRLAADRGQQLVAVHARHFDVE